MPKMGETEILFTRDTCKECGSEHLVYKETLAAEIKEGKATPGVLSGVPEVGIVMDGTKLTALIVPQIITLFDYCLDCGAKSPTAIIRTYVQRPQVQGQMMPQRPGGGGGSTGPNSDFFRNGGKLRP